MGTIKAGTYVVTVKGTHLGKSPKKGTGYVGVRFEDEVGDTITAFLYTSDAAIGRTIETLEQALGWNVEAHNGDLFSLHETDLLVGKQVEIVVEDEEYEGKYRPKVKWINALNSGGRVEGMQADDAKAFAAALRATVYGTRAGKAPGATPAARPAAKPAPAQAAAPSQGGDGPGEDDDLPF